MNGIYVDGKGGAASHTLAKQLYFPLPDDGYHLLAPLFPTALVHGVHTHLQEARFSDAAKAARAARRANPRCQITAVAVDEEGGSTAASVTVTFANNALVDCACVITVGMRRIVFAVHAGDTPTVIATAGSDEKCGACVKLGADHAIDASRQDVAREVMALTQGRGVDVVIENVGAATWSAAMRSLVRGGRLVTCGATSGDQPPADIRRIFIRQLQILGSTLGNRDEFRAMLGFCERAGLRPVIDSVYPLADVHQALSRLSSGQQFGKVCLTMDA